MLSDEKIYEIINNKLETPINHLKTEVLESEDEICTFFLNNVLNLIGLTISYYLIFFLFPSMVCN